MNLLRSKFALVAAFSLVLLLVGYGSYSYFTDRLSADELSFLEESGLVAPEQARLSRSALKPHNLIEQNLRDSDGRFEVLANRVKGDTYSLAFKLDNPTGREKEFILLPAGAQEELSFRGLRGRTNESRVQKTRRDVLDQPLRELYNLTRHRLNLEPELQDFYEHYQDGSYEVSPIKVTVEPHSTLLAAADFQITVDNKQLSPAYLLIHGSAGGAKDPIHIIDVHSSPQTGEEWRVGFETNGRADLTITLEDEHPDDFDEFRYLTCGSEKREANQNGNTIHYPDWQCEDTAAVAYATDEARDRTLIFEFAGETAYAYNTAGSASRIEPDHLTRQDWLGSDQYFAESNMGTEPPDSVYLEFNGTGQVNLSSTQTLSGEFTVEYWFRTDRSSDWRVLNNADSYNYALGHRASDQVAFWNPGVDISLSQSFATGEWEHIAVTRDTGDSVKVYLNGVEVGTDTWSGELRIDQLAGTPDNSGWDDYNGDLRDVRLWTTERTASQISDNYDQTLTGSETGLVAYWKLDEGSGSTAYDSAGGNDGYIEGALWPKSLTLGRSNVIAFTETGTHTWEVPEGVTEVDVLVVAGGGGGSGSDDSWARGSGGGAGGLIFKPNHSVSGDVSVKVGGGGAGGTGSGYNRGSSGEDSYFDNLVAKGGGGAGVRDDEQGDDGGSGGGIGGTGTQPTQTGDSGTYGHGHDGYNEGTPSRGAGGGAGEPGQSGNISGTEGGGDGLKEVTIDGTTYNFAQTFGTRFGEIISHEAWFAGGGGQASSDGALGGKGGGGTGWRGNTSVYGHDGEDGINGTGAGGGGGDDSGEGGSGGSGIVIIRYGEPLEEYEENGYRVSNPLSLDSVKEVATSSITWDATEPANTELQIYTALNQDDTTEPTYPDDYTEATNDTAIPGISTNDDLSGKYLWVRQEFSTSDTATTSKLHSLEYEVVAEDFAGGSGTESDPYQLSNCYHLQNMQEDLSAYYILTQDIDCSDTVNWNGGAGFEPVSGFTGVLDGQFFTIKDLYMVGGDGVFGDADVIKQLVIDGWWGESTAYRKSFLTDNGNNISDIKIINSTFYGKHESSFLTYDGNVERVAIHNSVFKDTSYRTSLFAGRSGTVKNSYARNSRMEDHGPTSDRWIMGSRDTDVEKTWTDSFNSSKKFSDETALDSFYDREVSNIDEGTGANPKTTAELKNIATYTDTATEGLDTAWDMVHGYSTSTVWGIDPAMNDGYPFLQVIEQQMKGDGTEANPYQITNVIQLQHMQEDLSAHYILMNDIDASGTVNWNGGAGFEPVGTFTGEFDGQGYTISGLYIDRPSTSGVGLFGVANGTVEDVILKDVDHTGYNKTGGLVGEASGATISDSKVSGSAHATRDDIMKQLGGFVGVTYGATTINRSAANVDLTWDNPTDDDRIGGFVGNWRDETQITNCYAKGSLLTGEGGKLGGFSGSRDFSSSGSYINKSFSTGYVDDSGNTSEVGGFEGRGVGSGTITNSFWDTETSGQSSSAGGTGKTTAEMKNISTYTDTATEGLDDPWDMVVHHQHDDETWWLREGEDYPRLWFEVLEVFRIKDDTNFRVKDDQDLRVKF